VGLGHREGQRVVPGSTPWVPVRYVDHGSSGDGQKASAVGRTWTTTVL
jgi:hypothetical protein